MNDKAMVRQAHHDGEGKSPDLAGQALHKARQPVNGRDGGGQSESKTQLTTLDAVIKRAMNLLDDGDLVAAKELSSKAYQDAKYAGQMGKRVHGIDQLIRKAHQLQGDALLIESRAKIGLADEYDAAQERGEMARGRPATLLTSVT